MRAVNEAMSVKESWRDASTVGGGGELTILEGRKTVSVDASYQRWCSVGVEGLAME